MNCIYLTYFMVVFWILLPRENKEVIDFEVRKCFVFGKNSYLIYNNELCTKSGIWLK